MWVKQNVYRLESAQGPPVCSLWHGVQNTDFGVGCRACSSTGWDVGQGTQPLWTSASLFINQGEIYLPHRDGMLKQIAHGKDHAQRLLAAPAQNDALSHHSAGCLLWAWAGGSAAVRTAPPGAASAASLVPAPWGCSLRPWGPQGGRGAPGQNTDFLFPSPVLSPSSCILP